MTGFVYLLVSVICSFIVANVAGFLLYCLVWPVDKLPIQIRMVMVLVFYLALGFFTELFGGH